MIFPSSGFRNCSACYSETRSKSIQLKPFVDVKDLVLPKMRIVVCNLRVRCKIILCGFQEEMFKAIIQEFREIFLWD